MRKLKTKPPRKTRAKYNLIEEFAHIKALKEIRISRNATQQEVAEALEVKQITFSCWELGYNIPRFDKFLQWCELLSYNPFQNK